MSFSILVVCTGNVCRSPLAEQLLAARLATAGIDASVSSGGTAALVGQAMPQEASALSLRYGGVPDRHVARQLTASLIDDADLVLTATREHRAAVASLVPRSARRAYTLAEFARIAEFLESSPEGAESLASVASPVDVIAAISMNRGFAAPPAQPTDDDIVDPYGRPAEIYEASARVIDAAVTAVVRALSTASRLGSRGAA
ncbi:low molecular weight phosphatase family protein [Agromyces albus]|uniref:Low molecular weight phosphatase family protein n=1 Tax=Agromyces albus TaxID=205332 RepID=A0A4Q2L707_9MICO|nr:low molecular weight phosphatase family protein [Agromyces albus]RXZ72232.1 low molecular weight phosphatase family protein [Agromyces albus]